MSGLGVQFHPTIKNEAYQIYCDTLTYLNMAFTTMFLVESILKILAFGLKVWMLLLCVDISRYLRDTQSIDRPGRPVPQTRPILKSIGRQFRAVSAVFEIRTAFQFQWIELMLLFFVAIGHKLMIRIFTPRALRS